MCVLVTQNEAGNWCAKRSGHISINTGSELPSLSGSKEYYQKTILTWHTMCKNVFITFLLDAAFGALARAVPLC
jgi:hypothetical protein